MSGSVECSDTVLGLQCYQGMVAEYDLTSGSKLGSTEAGDPPAALQYTSDATTLIGLTQVRRHGLAATICPS